MKSIQSIVQEQVKTRGKNTLNVERVKGETERTVDEKFDGKRHVSKEWRNILEKVKAKGAKGWNSKGDKWKIIMEE